MGVDSLVGVKGEEAGGGSGRFCGGGERFARGANAHSPHKARTR